jgi:hypothetical protein
MFGKNGFDEDLAVFEGDIQQFDLWDDANVAFRATEGNGRIEPELTTQCDTKAWMAPDLPDDSQQNFDPMDEPISSETYDAYDLEYG